MSKLQKIGSREKALELLSTKAIIHDVDFSGLDLSGIKVFGKVFFYCNFDNCTLRKAAMSHTEFIFCGFDKADISFANFKDSDFISCQFNLAEAEKTNFTNASLIRVKMASVNAPGANFTQANLYVFYAQNANFEAASFRSASLRETDFTRAILIKADITKTSLASAWDG